MTKRELAYLRHKAWHLGYNYIYARATQRHGLFGYIDYLFMGGIEQGKLLDVLKRKN